VNSSEPRFDAGEGAALSGGDETRKAVPAKRALGGPAFDTNFRLLGAAVKPSSSVG